MSPPGQQGKLQLSAPLNLRSRRPQQWAYPAVNSSIQAFEGLFEMDDTKAGFMLELNVHDMYKIMSHQPNPF